MKIFYGKVIKGEQIGEKQGFPTANLNPRLLAGRRLAKGVYIVTAFLESMKYPALLIYGVPGFKIQKNGKAEVYFLNYNGRIYGRTIGVQVHKKIRPLRFYSKKSALLKRIRQDIKITKNYFK